MQDKVGPRETRCQADLLVSKSVPQQGRTSWPCSRPPAPTRTASSSSVRAHATLLAPRSRHTLTALRVLWTRADACLPPLLVDLALAAGVESTLPAKCAPAQYPSEAPARVCSLALVRDLPAALAGWCRAPSAAQPTGSSASSAAPRSRAPCAPLLRLTAVHACRCIGESAPEGGGCCIGLLRRARRLDEVHLLSCMPAGMARGTCALAWHAACLGTGAPFLARPHLLVDCLLLHVAGLKCSDACCVAVWTVCCNPSSAEVEGNGREKAYVCDVQRVN